jgi:hypothetical protein
VKNVIGGEVADYNYKILSNPSFSSDGDEKHENDENRDPDHSRHSLLPGTSQHAIHRRRRSQGLLAGARAVFRPRLLPREDSQPLSIASAASSSIMTVSSKSGLGTPFPVDEDFFDDACALAITAANTDAMTTPTGTAKENIPPIDNTPTNDNTLTNDKTLTNNDNDHTDNDDTPRL